MPVYTVASYFLMDVAYLHTHTFLKSLVLISSELNPHLVGEAFYNGEVETELRRIKKIDYKFKHDSDRDECMEMIEEQRRERIYSHDLASCTSECKSRGQSNYLCTKHHTILTIQDVVVYG